MAFSPPPATNPSSPPLPRPNSRPRGAAQRRTQAEREAQAQEDDRRRQERIASETPTSGTTRGRRGAGRGRGRAAKTNVQLHSRASERVRAEDSGGVFGSAPEDAPRPKPRRGLGADIGGAEELLQVDHEENTVTIQDEDETVEDAPAEVETTKPKKPATRKPRAKPAKKDAPPEEPQVYVDSDEDIRGTPIRDIERIWLSSEDEAADAMDVDEDEEPVLSTARRKVRITSGQDLLRPLRAPREIHSENTERIELDKTKEADEIDIDEHFGVHAPIAAEVSRKPRRKSTRQRDGKPNLTETTEEREERLRYADDVQKLRSILLPAALTEHKAEENISMNDDTEENNLQQHPEEGKLYLFQFPPMTPFLVNDTSTYEIDIALEDPDAPVKRPVPLPSQVKNEKTEDVEIKIEEDGDVEGGSTKPPLKVPSVVTAKAPPLPAGSVGRINVHKSGKITMSWGGTDMEVRYGTDVDFLQEMVLLDGDGEGNRSAFDLGRVERKMVVVPDWQKLYE